MKLRPYQEAMLESVVAELVKGNTRILLKAPTGTGKTIAFAALLDWPGIQTWLAQWPTAKGARLLIVAHREELLDQAADKIRRQNPGLMVSIEQGDRYANRYSDVVIASIQTLAARKYARLKRLQDYHRFRIVVIDEAHHAAADTYRTTLAHLGFLPKADISERDETEAANWDDVDLMRQALQGWDAAAPRDQFLLGVTATPNRTDAIGLGCVFQTMPYAYGLKDAIEDKWLVPIKPWTIETSESLDQVHTVHGDFNQKELAETVNTPRRNRLAVDAWKLYASDRSTLAFTVDVQHAHDLALAFTAVGVQCAALSGETPKDQRREILAAYTRGEVQVITNCMVLTEGTDLPRTGCILHAKPTKSATLYEQMTGRGLRIFPQKTDCIVLDLVDVARRHSLQNAPVLYGLPPGLNTKGETLDNLEAELEDYRQRYPAVDLEKLLAAGRLSLRELLDRASTFDIWTVPSLGHFGEGLRCNWIKVNEERFRVQYPWADGIELIQVEKDLLNHWSVSLTFRPASIVVAGNLVQPPVRQRTLAAQIENAKAAALIAETFITNERRSVLSIKDREAPWRSRPASNKQKILMTKWRIPFHPKITMGEASDKIDLAQARKAR